jgi:hypothetical protein
MKTTETEKRVLQSLHLRGIMGNMGSMKQKERLSLLQGLILRGLLTNDCVVTPLGIEVSAPFYVQP